MLTKKASIYLQWIFGILDRVFLRVVIQTIATVSLLFKSTQTSEKPQLQTVSQLFLPLPFFPALHQVML